MITLKLFAWLLVIAGNLAWHIVGIIRKSKPDYLLTNILRGVAAILLCVWLTPGLSEAVELGYFAPILIYCVSSYVVIFNPAMNLLKNLYTDAVKVGFWYYGKKSGWLGELFTEPLVYKTVYFSCVVLLILSTIVIYHQYA